MGQDQADHGRLTGRLIDALYVEAMLLADEARAYFDSHGRAEREALPPLQRVGFSCESLKVTTRLMHIIAWLLTRRGVEAGEISSVQANAPERRLGQAAESAAEAVEGLPATARALIGASIELYLRIRRLDESIDRPAPAASPARGLQKLLASAF